jgi:hypothetical protein
MLRPRIKAADLSDHAREVYRRLIAESEHP